MKTLLTTLLAGAAMTLPVAAGPITFNFPALAPGSQFRIVFVTSTTGLASSQNIADYNTFVNNAANAGGSELAFLGATWTAIVSTGGSGVVTPVNALANIGGTSTLPIYTLDGTLVANGTTALFGASTGSPLLGPIDIEETGVVVTGTTQAYTGTGSISNSAPGQTDPFGHGLGNAFNQDETGAITSTGESWIHFTQQNGGELPLQFFGISGTLTVPGKTSATPEPGTLGFMVVGAAAMLIVLKRRA